MAQNVRIAVDAMGGDFGPSVTIPGCALALERRPESRFLLIGDAVDVGAVVSEFFTLALDPYPRKPGAEFVEPAPDAASEAASPFARLKSIAGGKPPAGD